jgi:hypothetical protein
MARMQGYFPVDASPESAMSLAGLQKAIQSGFTIQAPIILMFTGK